MQQTNQYSNRWGNRGGALPAWQQKAKLLPKQRDEIRARLADGENPLNLATEYGVSAGTIRQYR